MQWRAAFKFIYKRTKLTGSRDTRPAPNRKPSEIHVQLTPAPPGQLQLQVGCKLRIHWHIQVIQAQNHHDDDRDSQSKGAAQECSSAVAPERTVRHTLLPIIMNTSVCNSLNATPSRWAAPPGRRVPLTAGPACQCSPSDSEFRLTGGKQKHKVTPKQARVGNCIISQQNRVPWCPSLMPPRIRLSMALVLARSV